ncbi:MAG: hypothetical protein ACREKL_16465 [Chthoniobacterales bacterium]
MKTTIKLAVCALVLSAVSVFAGDAKGEKVEVKDLPAAVTKSVSDKWPGSTIATAKKQPVGDTVVYRLKVTKDKDTYIAVVAPDGTIKKSKSKE